MTTTAPPVRPLAPIARVADLSCHQLRMDQPLVAYRRVGAAGRSSAPVPAFLFGPSDADLTRMLYGQLETPEIGCTGIADAAVAPTGIGLCDGVAFAGASLNQPREHVATIVARLNQMSLLGRHVAAPLVPLFGPAEEDAGVVLIDYLPRLWLLQQAGHALDTLHVLLPGQLSPFLQQVVDALGIPADRRVQYAHWQEVLRTDLLLLPTILRRHERVSPHFGAATRFWTDRLRATLGLPDSEPKEALYLADPPKAGPALHNRTRIEAVAERLGYRVVTIGDMSLAERAVLFGSARCIVGACASALQHSVFSAPGTTVCVLRGLGREQGAVQTGVSDALGQSAGYVFGVPQAGGFSVDETDFRRALAVMDLPRATA